MSEFVNLPVAKSLLDRMINQSGSNILFPFKID